jgi:hypothetical protein
VSFFDELGQILEEKQRQREKVMGTRDDGRPYSSMLTQDEEPSYDYYNPITDEGEPEVIIRGQ